MNPRTTLLAGALALAALASAQQPAARQAALAGNWRLNLAASQMGADHPAAGYSFTKTISISGEKLTVADHEVNQEMAGISIPESSSTTELVADGQERTVQLPPLFPGLPPSQAQVSAEWQGDNLVVTTAANSFMGASTTRRRHFLSGDGQRLVVLVTSVNTFGESEQRLVFDRVQPTA